MECAHIPEIDYGQYSERFLQRVYQERIPFSGSIELTERCCLSCAHCYISQPAASQEIRQRELSLDEWRGLLDQMAEAGCLWLLVTGGEPLLRPDFWEIYSHAHGLGMLLTLFTNGTLITPALADRLAQRRPHAVEITLYGATQETYEKVTGVPGSYAKCLRGIDLLLERGLPLKLKAMAFRLNHHEIPAMQAMAEARGVEFRFDPHLNLRLDGQPGPQVQRLTPEEVVAFDRADPKRVEGWQQLRELYAKHPLPDERLFTCAAGLASFHIDPYGRLSPCVIARTPSYDLRAGSFTDGWYGQITRVQDQRQSTKTPCQDCAIRYLCDQCAGWAELETGSLEQPVEYLCRVSHLRSQVLEDFDKES
jgi:radical SAM protein with 4Fe4S-binding SPASM domain